MKDSRRPIKFERLKEGKIVSIDFLKTIAFELGHADTKRSFGMSLKEKKKNYRLGT